MVASAAQPWSRGKKGGRHKAERSQGDDSAAVATLVRGNSNRFSTIDCLETDSEACLKRNRRVPTLVRSFTLETTATWLSSREILPWLPCKSCKVPQSHRVDNLDKRQPVWYRNCWLNILIPQSWHLSVFLYIYTSKHACTYTYAFAYAYSSTMFYIHSHAHWQQLQ